MKIKKYMYCKHHAVYIATILALYTSSITLAHSAPSFNSAFLSDDLSNADISDLSRFDNSDYQLPGVYRVELYVNGDYFSAADINFIEIENKKGKSELFPCFDNSTLESFGVNIRPTKGVADQNQQCVPFTSLIEGSSATFNFKEQKLLLSFPQASLNDRVRGYISPERWEEGIKALFLNYNMSGNNNSDKSNGYYIGIDSGFNLGAWQFRQSSSWNYNSNSGSSSSQWRNLMNYVQRPIIAIKSQLVIGDGNTNNSVFDSLGFRGIRLYSADNMYPDSQQGYAPTVRGIAKTDAKVVIRQNGYVIYQIYVTPGPFIIDDLNPTTTSGDLQVTIEENDGSSQRYIVPYSTLPLLQREGRVKYDVVAGEFRSGNNSQDKPVFLQATLLTGLSQGASIYTGTQLASKYKAVLVGIGQNLGQFGALSFDITHANSELADGSRHKGQSLRFLYAKSLNELGTTFQLLGYRYSTKGFYSLEDVAYKEMYGYEYAQNTEGYNHDDPIITNYHNLRYNKKGRFQVNISQSLGDYGSLYVSGNQQTYWGRGGKDEWYQAGYSNAWNGLNYSVSISTSRNIGINDRDNMLSMNLSLPLSVFSKKASWENSPINNAYATFGATNNSRGNESYRAGVSGTLLDKRNLSYTVSQGHVSQQGYTGSLGLAYQGTYGNYGVGYNYDTHQSQLNYNASGGILIHENGITFGQPIGDSAILVKAPGAAGVAVENYTGVKTDWRGYAILPYASNYRNNRIALDPDTFGDNVEIKNNVENVIPMKGSITRATFNTSIGIRALITFTHNGKLIRFGSLVKENNSQVNGIVGDDGRAYITGLPLSGELLVKWGNRSDEQCISKYDLSKKELNTSIVQTSLECK